MNAPAGRVDLLTAILHETGHCLGLDDSYAEQDRDNLMYGYLTVGERRLPMKNQAKNAQPGHHQGIHFLALPPVALPPVAPALIPSQAGETVSIPAFTLPAGKTVTVMFQVQLLMAACRPVPPTS